MYCVILLLMKDMAAYHQVKCRNSTLTVEALSFILFYSTVQDVLYLYKPLLCQRFFLIARAALWC